MKVVTHKTEDVSGEIIEILIFEREPDEVFKVESTLWAGMVYANIIMHYFSSEKVRLSELTFETPAKGSIRRVPEEKNMLNAGSKQFAWEYSSFWLS